MKKKNYKGKVIKLKLEKCEGICRVYSDEALRFAKLLNESDEITSFEVNVLLEGLNSDLKGEYTSDFVIKKADGLSVREVVDKNKLSKPLTCKELDSSRNFWLMRGVSDWGIILQKGKENERD